MKNLIAFMVSFHFTLVAYTQKVGIGTNTPEMKLQVAAADSAVLQISNSTPMDENTNLGVYFKNGDWYTAALRTIAASSNTARLGIFTYATTVADGLKERISITDGGMVGINNTNPEAYLHVNGTQIIRNDPPFTAPALNVTSTLNSVSIPAVNVEASTTGIITGTLQPAATGLLAWNGQLPLVQPGTAVTAHSSNGNAIYAQSIKSNSFSIFATSVQPSVTAGRFQNNGGGKALVTSGGVQIEGLGAAAGKVLTSDAAGNASWQPAGTNVAFRGYLAYDIPLSPTSTFPITGITALANDGNALNTAAGEFTAPSDGWYQFTVNIQYTLPSASMRMAVDFLRNGFVNTGMTFQFLIGTSTPGQLDTRSVSQLLKLAANDKVSFQFRHVAGTGTINIFGQGSTTTTMFYGVKL